MSLCAAQVVHINASVLGLVVGFVFISLLRGCRFVRFVLEVLRSPLQFAASVSGRRTRGEKHVARARWLVPMRRGEPC